MQNRDSIGHVTGKSVYVDDIPVQKGTLYGKVFGSPVAHGKIKSLDLSDAISFPGVEAVLTARDIPGNNQIGGIIPDEVLFAEDKVAFHGQPVAFIVADSELNARKAAELIQIEIEELEPVTDPRIAKEKGLLLFPPNTFSSGNTDDAWKQCTYVFSGQADVNGQEHLYIETQGAYAYPTEHGGVKLHSSTQGPTHVQHTTAHVIGIPMHRVEVDVTRLGGGFGGKEDQATAYACMAALAAWKLQKPVKVILHRMDDMQMTGKRHPYSADFKIGLDKDYKILAYEAVFYQNGGAASDLSPAVLDRSLFHSTNTYYIPNTKITGYSCKTNLPPNTAFRGFGGPQGMFFIETAIAKAARELNIPASSIQMKNILKENDSFLYGQIAENVNIQSCFDTLNKHQDIELLQKEADAFNNKNKLFKKGLAIMPICFGISFTKTTLNQARALVHVYNDGSIGVSTGAIEMGQGVNTKIIQVAAKTFSVSADRVKTETTNTTRVSNTSPTAASAGADLNGKATEIACAAIKNRLLKYAASILDAKTEDVILKDEYIYSNGRKTKIYWEELVKKAYTERICLTENGHYATPEVHFDTNTKKGHPFAYHVYGASTWLVTLDCVRGTYIFDKVDVVHDFGNSMNLDIDLGQAEGALVQGLGWMTMEELSYDAKGVLKSNSLSTYKIPDIYSVPKELNILPLDSKGPELAILRSKAVGEPPLMYGIGAYFALYNAIKAFNPNAPFEVDAPMTPEKALMLLYKG